LQCIDQLQPKSVVLTHIGHTLDAWLIGHRGELPANVGGGFDGCVL
jgi:phosphoribosyl 1,2-cyclic phosphate phosphodiesterase